MAGRKSTATMELAIGATIIAGVILLISMLMIWGNSSSFLSQHYRVLVNMVNVGGLKEGAPVKMGGFQIGRVASIQIRSGSTEMEIVLDIDENRWLPKDSKAKVSTAGLVGDAFMEIIPGTSSEHVKQAKTLAEADRLESSPLPDMGELFVKVSTFGDQLSILTNNINDIVGDLQFRTSVKQLAVNMNDVALQASQILKNSQDVIANIELATQNVVTLSNTLKDRVDEVTLEVKQITGKANEIAAKTETVLDEVSDKVVTLVDNAGVTIGSINENVAMISEKAGGAIDNLNDGITDIRRGVNNTIGDKEMTDNLKAAVNNFNTVAEGLAERRPDTDKLIRNLSALSNDLNAISGRVREITNNLEPASVATTLNALTSAINSMTEVVEKIKAEPVLALSVNKAADRIVKMKFDEMSKQQQFRSADEVLREINRWVRENMNQGYFTDPSYHYNQRPYSLGK